MLPLFPRRFKDFIQDPYKLDALEEEHLMYQSMSNTEIPEDIWEQSLVKDMEERKYYRMDMIWGYLRTSLPRLADNALFLLTIPHSNAAEERIFSMITKNKTTFRSSLDNNRSLNSIMRIKMNKPESFKPCYQWKFSEELMKKCKKACMGYNAEHSNHEHL